MISTPFTQMLDIRHPIVQAGMGGVARAELAAAVSNAGGLGMLGMVRMPQDFIRKQIRQTRALTSRPFGVNLIPSVAPESGFESQLDVCLDEHIPVVSLFWCDAEPYVGRCHSAGTILMLQVGSVDEARRAAEIGVDLIVAQGVEAGGHVRGQTSLFPLLSAVVDAVSPIPVIAAGGIADGRGLAAALALGAASVWVGTRFVATSEAEAHTDYKERLLSASAADTIYTETFHVGWPPQSPHRVLRNSLTNGDSPPPGPVAHVHFDGRKIPVPTYGSMPPTVHTEGRTELMANYAGQGVGLIQEILPAADVVHRIVSQAESIIQRLSATTEHGRGNKRSG